MNVVATAPRPGVIIPSRPVAGAIDLGGLPERDLDGDNFLLRCNYDCARRGAGLVAVFGDAGLVAVDSLIMRIGVASMRFVMRYTKAILCTAVIHAVTVSRTMIPISTQPFQKRPK